MERIAPGDIPRTETGMAYNAACKKLLGNKPILAWLMKGCVSEFRECGIKEIVECIEGEPVISGTEVSPDATNPSYVRGIANEDTSVSEGKIVYDIIFTAVTPGKERIRMIINVEAQSNFYPGYPLLTRIMYYLCRMVSSQKEREFTGSNYGDIKKVYSIWVCAEPPERMRNTITEYSMKETQLVGEAKAEREHYDIMRAVVVGLGDEEESDAGTALNLMDVLLRSKKTAEEKKDILEEEYEIKVTDEMDKEVNSMCNLSYGVYMEGRQEGRLEGEKNGLLNAALSVMNKMKLTFEQALDFVGVPQDEYEAYKKMANV